MGKAHFNDEFKRDAMTYITERDYPTVEFERQRKMKNECVWKTLCCSGLASIEATEHSIPNWWAHS